MLVHSLVVLVICAIVAPLIGRTPCTANAMTVAEQQQLVDIHNALRRGEGASNMQTITWNPTVASVAQSWADACNFMHGQSYNSSGLSGIGMGQNLYASSGSTTNLTAAVIAWFNEKVDFFYSSNACATGKVCRHYTQVVWSNTNQIGCGYAICSPLRNMSWSGSSVYVVCNYALPGNYVGKKPYLQGSPCTACSTGKFFCTDGLCNDTCSAPSTSCVCAASCKNCATQTADCRCQCGTGWAGVDCSAVCTNTDVYCREPGALAGYPKSYCDTNPSIRAACPAYCGDCVAGTPSPCDPTTTTTTATTTAITTTPTCTVITTTPTLTTTTIPTTATPSTNTMTTASITTATPTTTTTSTTTPTTTTIPNGPNGTGCACGSFYSRPRDCYDLKISGWTVSGVYDIWPNGAMEPWSVYCDMNGGGWTVIQRRAINGTVAFNRTWTDYANGFGNVSGDMWIGNDKINSLTNTTCQQRIGRVYSLNVTMVMMVANKLQAAVHATFNNFRMATSLDGYRLLSLGTCVGTKCPVGVTGLFTSVGLKFSTFDQDNDKSNTTNCATSYRGGWWFNSCFQTNLNGISYANGIAPAVSPTFPDGLGIKWFGYTTSTSSLVFTEMKIRPTI